MLRLKALVLSSFAVSGLFAGEPITFDTELPTKWKASIGSWEVRDGVLVGTEVAADKHAAASRYFIPITDGEVKFRFRRDSSQVISFGFDPAKGELKKKGHLFSVIVTGNAIMLKKHRDKANADSKDVTLDSVKTTTPSGEWTDVMLTLAGKTASASVGEHVLTGTDDEFAVAKPGVVFRVSKGSASFDDVVVSPQTH